MVGLIFAVLVLGAGCKQGIGGRCEVDDDCSSGLVCVNRSGTGGECTDSLGMPVIPRNDASDVVGADGATVDIPAPSGDAPSADTAPTALDATGDATSDTSVVD